MELSAKEYQHLVQEIARETGAKRDGTGKNLIVPRCPFCGKSGGKFGIYIGPTTSRREPFMAHCFSCGRSTRTLEQLLEAIGRMDLMVTPTADITAPLVFVLGFEPDEIDDELEEVELPDFYKRTFCHPYLKERGFIYDDYDYFPVGATNRLNRRFADYVIFPVIDNGKNVGFVGRHTRSKNEIDTYNRKAKVRGDYKILRYRNSTNNDFSKLLYNYDAIREGTTEIVILTEGIFDVIALTRKLDLYDNQYVATVATFGKKISDVQIFKLQCKGIKTVIIGYDGDAVHAIKKTAQGLSRYFAVFVANITDAHRDWDEMSKADIMETFFEQLISPSDYQLNKVQEL